jgi:hypothetical protein
MHFCINEASANLIENIHFYLYEKMEFGEVTFG